MRCTSSKGVTGYQHGWLTTVDSFDPRTALLRADWTSPHFSCRLQFDVELEDDLCLF